MTKSTPVLLTATLLLACLQVLGAADATVFGLQETPEEMLVEVSPALSVTSAAPGRTYRAAVVADVAPGWHINSAHPRQDYLIPAAVGSEIGSRLCLDCSSGLLGRTNGVAANPCQHLSMLARQNSGTTTPRAFDP